MRRQRPPRKPERTAERGARAASYLAEPLERRVLLAADVVVSEFMAKNTTTLKDNFGDYSDWVELHNAGDATADLSGAYLTDSNNNLRKWQFPAGTTLAAGGFLVVYASDRDLAVAGQPLHTNFKLDDTGEYLALVQSDGAVKYSYTPKFPAQTSDVAYGMVDADNPASSLGFFTSPTPGAANAPGVQPVTFSQAGGGYTASIAVTLSSATPGRRSATRPTAPRRGATSPPHTGPITISRDTMLRARAFATGLTASPVTSQQYFILDSTVSAFHSNLPLVVIDTFGRTIGQSGPTAASAMVLSAPTDGADTTLAQTPQFIGRAALTVRGQSSTGFPKLQYHFEVWDENNNDKDTSLLGMPADSDWVLYAPYSEKSLMQNQLAYQWSNAIAQYAVRTRWVEVFLHTGAGATINYNSDYVGVYLLMEKIKVAPDRVDVNKLGPGDDAAPAVTGGYIWKKDKTDGGGESGFSTPRQSFLYEDPNSTDLDAAQKAYLTNYVNQFESALYGPNFKNDDVGYAQYIDVQSFVDHWIMVEMAKNIDGFRLSTYYYKDLNGLMHMGPIWDYNLTMGNANYFDGQNATGWYHNQLGATQYTYFDRLTQDSEFMQRIATRWQQVRETVFSTSQLMADIDANFQTLTDGNGNIPVGANPPQAPNNPVVRNFQKWHILGTNIWPNYYVGNSWGDEVAYLKTFISTRVAWMDSQLAALVPTAPPGTPRSLTATAVSGVQVGLGWTAADAFASKFDVDASSDAGATWARVGTAAASAASYLVGGLTPGRSYSFRVLAANSLGASPASNTATAATGPTTPLIDRSGRPGTPVTLNGSAKVSGTSLALTDGNVDQAASAFATGPVEVYSFKTTFEFQLTNPVGDGFTFTLQNNGPTAVGAAGGGLGYAGIPRSVAVKFDLYNNSGEGTNSTGVFLNGHAPVTGGAPGDVSLDMTPSGVNLHTGDLFRVTLQYAAGSLTQTVRDMFSTSTYSHTYAVDIPAAIGGDIAYVGFTGGTGGATATQEILNWTYSAQPPPAPTGLAATAGIGTVALSWAAAGTMPSMTYNVYRGTNPAGSDRHVVATGLTNRTYTDTGLTKGTTYYYAVTAVDAGGESAASAQATATVRGPDFQVNDGNAQRSMVTSIAVNFGTPATPSAGAFSLVRRGDGAIIGVSAAIPAGGDGSRWVLTFSAPDMVAGSLADGIYDLTVNGAFVSASGKALFGGASALAFHRLYSDADGDGDSDNVDLFMMRSAYGKSRGDPAYRSYFDFEDDGDVDNADLLQVRNRRTKTFKWY